MLPTPSNRHNSIFLSSQSEIPKNETQLKTGCLPSPSHSTAATPPPMSFSYRLYGGTTPSPKSNRDPLIGSEAVAPPLFFLTPFALRRSSLRLASKAAGYLSSVAIYLPRSPRRLGTVITSYLPFSLTSSSSLPGRQRHHRPSLYLPSAPPTLRCCSSSAAVPAALRAPSSLDPHRTAPFRRNIEGSNCRGAVPRCYQLTSHGVVTEDDVEDLPKRSCKSSLLFLYFF
ncbi:uncharacterized protein LOC125189571 [Salvia hispanica]|uniref:uncharacterized protein LOC125189571 n=1 Tax=Salvia hispanica TaxID=49212 RepID=UPI00200984EA|nr:uncharacterized protein LOC125189571 [Salvia hispanica]